MDRTPPPDPHWHDERALTMLLDLPGAARAVLVPTWVLGVLPLHATRYRVDGRPRHLSDDVAVSHTPSARVLAAARGATADPARTPPPPHLVGDAEPHPCDPPLAGAKSELTSARALFGGSTVSLTGPAATRDALLRALPGATHLHFAGHEYYDPDEPLASRLALDDGEQITMRDLLDGDAVSGVRLVVASACRTAVTDMARLPDESVGLPAGLVQAGATAVIGTLEEVDDRSTALLVARFYDLHLHGDPARGEPLMPPSAALAPRPGVVARHVPARAGRVRHAGRPAPPQNAGPFRRTPLPLSTVRPPSATADGEGKRWPAKRSPTAGPIRRLPSFMRVKDGICWPRIRWAKPSRRIGALFHAGGEAIFRRSGESCDDADTRSPAAYSG
ncbi:CHAT domain-containing protein [Streptomyces antibioticus]|uniref:CHAT domain-containing protein n=1 Tax=Streptomyces antibioticus TaxID=1890 RepID=UPI0036D9E7F1